MDQDPKPSCWGASTEIRPAGSGKQAGPGPSALQVTGGVGHLSLGAQEAAEKPWADREEAGGHKVRLFLKWTEWVRSKVGRDQRRGIWLCAPWGLAPSSSCPPTPGLGQPMALPTTARQSQAGAGGSLGRGCWWGVRRPVLSPHLPDGQGCLSVPLLAGGDRSLCTQLPNGSHGDSLQPGSGAGR